MSRIEFNDVEQKMEDLRGYCKTTYDPDKNPYRADLLTDDEFNFVSGMNYVLSYVTDNYLDNNEDFSKMEMGVGKKKLRRAINDFAQWGYSEIAEIMTSFIESHEEEE